MGTSLSRALYGAVKRRDVLAIGIAISIIEDNLPEKPPLLKLLSSRRRRPESRRPALVIGVTGAAGSGKSTLIAGLAAAMRRDRKRVAVIAIDPTSPRTKGAFLGDRVRMQDLAEDPGVFIRSMASRSGRGGIAKAAGDVKLVFFAAGFDVVFIETVGAGQLDCGVMEISDVTILIVTPEGGDEIQMMKAGLAELADVFVVNKADRPGADRTAHFLEAAHASKTGQTIPVFQTVAEEKKGIRPLYQFVRSTCRAKKIRR